MQKCKMRKQKKIHQAKTHITSISIKSELKRILIKKIDSTGGKVSHQKMS